MSRREMNTPPIARSGRQQDPSTAPRDPSAAPATTSRPMALHRSVPVIVGLLGVALAMWLWFSRFALSYPIGDPRTDAFLNEALAAIVVGMAGLARMLSPLRRLRGSTVVQAVVGLWLAAAPFAIGYGEALPEARANHIVCGLLAVALAAIAFTVDADRPDAS